MKNHMVLYDDQCPLCVAQMRLLKKLDWLGFFRPLGLSDPSVKALAPQLRQEELQAAIHCLSSKGQVYRGAKCLRFLAIRLPLLAPLALLLWVPGALKIAEIIYRWVSRNRLVLSRLCKA